MYTTMIIILVWFAIATYCFHHLMSEQDREGMYKNKITFVVFMILAPFAVLYVLGKSIFGKS